MTDAVFNVLVDPRFALRSLMNHHCLEFSVLQHAFLEVLKVDCVENYVFLDAPDSKRPGLALHILVVVAKYLSLGQSLKCLLLVAGVRFIDFSSWIDFLVDFFLLFLQCNIY